MGSHQVQGRATSGIVLSLQSETEIRAEIAHLLMRREAVDAAISAVRSCMDTSEPTTDLKRGGIYQRQLVRRCKRT
jgi:hypothetical protein